MAEPLPVDIAKLTDDEWRVYLARSAEFTDVMMKIAIKVAQEMKAELR
jgi:hypothetical protein